MEAINQQKTENQIRFSIENTQPSMASRVLGESGDRDVSFQLLSEVIFFLQS